MDTTVTEYIVACPTCDKCRFVSKVAYWHITSPKGRSSGDCKSCSLRKKTYPGRKNPGNDGKAISKRMKGNSYAKGFNGYSDDERTRRSKVMIGNKLSLGRVGPLSPGWKGGITKDDKLERLRFRREMQKEVFTRDNFTCILCKESGKYIQVDHIKKWSEYPELRFDINNCRTLCMKCHYKVTFNKEIPEGTIWGHNLSKSTESRITS